MLQAAERRPRWGPSARRGTPPNRCSQRRDPAAPLSASAVRHPPNEEKSFISAIQRDKDASYVVNPNISYSVTNASFLAPNISQISGINQGAPTPGTDKMATPFFAELQPSNTGQSKITVPEFKLEEVSQEKLPLESAPGIEQPGARHAHRLTLGQELPGDFVPSQEGLQDDQLDLQIRHQYLQEQQLRNQLLHQQILQQQSVLQQQQMLSQHYSSFGSSLMHSAQHDSYLQQQLLQAQIVQQQELLR